MFLVISTSTFIAIATMALLIWAGVILRFTGRVKPKKATRPSPTLTSFFQPTAGKTTVDVPMPMASYQRNELALLNRPSQFTTDVVAEEPVPTPTETTTSPATELDDPTFAASPSPTEPVDPPTPSHQPTGSDTVAPSGFRIEFDRQLLTRLLSDDTLCEEFETVRALTLERQRETGRSYASLYREAIADKPADVQAVLLNLLTEDEGDDLV